MQKILSISLLCLYFVLSTFNLLAQSDNTIWISIHNHELGSKKMINERNMPIQFQAYQIVDLQAMEYIFQRAPLRFSAEANQSNIEIALPMPNGKLENFKIFNFPVLQPRIAAAYPELRTFTAAGIRNPNLTAKIEMTPHGLFAMILGSKQGPIFVNPFNVKDQTYYSFYKKDIRDIGDPFYCEVETTHLEDMSSNINGNSTFAGDCQLRQYRIALACTGEYAQLIDDGDDTNGDIVADVLADMVIIMNRINGIFEREVGVTMVIIDENEEIIFTDPDTDFYSNVISSLPAENNTAMQITVGDDSHDIGHVFGSTGGGRAFVEGPCTSFKPAAASGRGNRTAEVFALDIVVHEIGHQFGARHTFNTTTNFCSEFEASSYEPGSGSTIMGYARVCPPLVQPLSDDYFHAISLEQMGEFITTTGNSCPVILNSDNNVPSASAGENYTIPISTPFVLTGVGIDADADPITYCWEQWDREELEIVPPVPTSIAGPSFRSFLPKKNSQRYFPSLDVLVGETPDTWEVLPTVSRELNFRLTVRDNNSAYGCSDESDMTVFVDDSAGPFAVTFPDSSALWNIGDTETITWDVANTDAAPINCANVDILFSTDGGYTYPNILAANIPNNGNYEITVPNIASGKVRFMVRCSDNIFFAISEANIPIGVVNDCVEFSSSNIPLIISPSGPSTIISELNIDIDRPITNIKVIDVVGTHTYLGDLRFTLISPSGTACILINQKCAIEMDFDVNFDDEGDPFSCPYDEEKIIIPEGSLSIFDESDSGGIWQLEVADLASSDGGELISWGLEICYLKSLAVSSNDLTNFEETKIELRPNPIDQQLTVSMHFNNPFEGQLQVIDMMGQTLEQVDFESQGKYQHHFELGDLSAGVYFLNVVDQKGNRLVEKFIKL